MPEAIQSVDFKGLSLAAARRAIVPVLRERGLEEPEREARLLIELATRMTAERVLLEEGRPLTADEATELSGFLKRRLGRVFEVTRAVLDPRPETETLIDAVLEHVDATGGRGRALRLLDVGTGSGAIMVTLLKELPNATGLGTDVSPAALEVAKANARRHGVEGRVTFEVRRSLDGIAGPFDVLVSNPPYIARGDLAGLAPEVRNFDPPEALDGGADGLDIYRQIARRAGEVVPHGLLALEVGAGQANDVGRIFTEALAGACKGPILRADLGGHARCVAVLTHS